MKEHEPSVPLFLNDRTPVPDDIIDRLGERLVERITREAAPDEAAGLLSAAYILIGLKVPRPLGAQLFRGVRAMRESSTYQAILDEGREDGSLRQTRKLLLRLGNQKFGAPGPEVEASVQAINELDRLERMSDRMFTAASWDDLLATR